MGRTSDLSPAERRDIVLMMLRREEPITTLSRRYGVSENTLHRWRDDFFNGGEAFSSSPRIIPARLNAGQLQQQRRLRWPRLPLVHTTEWGCVREDTSG